MNIERHSQVSESIEKIENRDESRALRFSKMELSELLSEEIKFFVSEGDRDVRNFFDAHKLKKIELGEYFSYLKLKAGHGKFEELIKKEYPNISTRTVRRYMSAFLNKDKVLDSITNNKETKKIKAKKERGEKLTPSENRVLIIYNTAYQIKKTLTLISTHGVEETFTNYIPEEKKESLQKDLITISSSEISRLQVKLQKKDKETETAKMKFIKLDRERRLMKRQLKEREQLILDLQPKG
jgi:hypothetical protein